MEFLKRAHCLSILMAVRVPTNFVQILKTFCNPCLIQHWLHDCFRFCHKLRYIFESLDGVDAIQNVGCHTQFREVDEVGLLLHEGVGVADGGRLGACCTRRNNILEGVHLLDVGDSIHCHL